MWGLFLIVFLFRFLLITSLPGGLFPDEAANGLDVNLILDGKLQPFYERGNGREALFFYLLTPAVSFFGRTPFAHHLVSALLGVLVSLITYSLAKRWFSPRVAFVSGILTAVSGWYVTMSRTAFRANAAPLFALLFFYFATRVAQAKSRKEYWFSAIVAGLSLGLGFYTYISFRMMIPILGLIFLVLLFNDIRNNQKELLKRYWKAFSAGSCAFLAGISWLVLFFIKNPEWIGGRAGQVSIFSQDNNGSVFETFFDVVAKTFLGFITGGDLNYRHNVAGFPFLSYLIAPLFVGGLLLVAVQAVIYMYKTLKRSGNLEQRINRHRLPYFIVALWFFFMLVPEILTAEGIPHGLRLVGIIPAVFIISALFIEEIITILPH